MEDPVIHRNYVFLLCIFVTFATDSQAFSQGSIGNFFYVNFMVSEFSYLNTTSIGRNLIQDENDCGYACLEIPACFSYNVAAFSDVNGKLVCELLPSDKFNHSDKFNTSREFHHFYLPSLCDSSPCKKAGKCISLYQENGYKCICVEGFTGKNCQTNINDCANVTCLNNGTSIDLINGFNCSCPPGFAGNRCEMDINECESSPCLNNGTCTDRRNGFNCSCPPGFSGTRCEIDINECENSPCLNNGTCTDRINEFNCSCPPGVSGNRCEIAKKNCAELYKSGEKLSGVYTIDPDGSGVFDVFCDQKTDGGGWTVFQKRLDGSVDFYRGWTDYKRGFGNLNGEFWLGLDKIHRLTKTRNKLRVDLEDTTGNTVYAEYDMFAVTSERTKYQLSLGTYSGTAGDSFSYHRGHAFSTKDRHNGISSSNCAVTYKGAWWYHDCHASNLNGVYHQGSHSSYADGVNWKTWKGYRYSAKRAEMKIRPANF